MKCMGCLLAFELPDGIWCLKFKGIVDSVTAEKCRDFLPRSFCQMKESENNERENI